MIGALPRRLAPALLLLAACATAPPPPPPPPAPPQAVAQPRPALPPSEAGRLDEAARLLADGVDLPRAVVLLAAVAPSARRNLLLGQLAELCGEDADAVAFYDQVLAAGDDDEVRLRRALALERLGRGQEAADDLKRLRAVEPRPPPPTPPPRALRPLKPSSR
jgi:tetratricopeptide (TPR) repeat protein